LEPETLESQPKAQKDSDSSLVSNENFSEILWPSSWALSQVSWAKMAQKLLHLNDITHKKFATRNQKFVWVQTRWLADLFEPLNNSLAQLVEEPWHWQGNWQLLVLGQFRSTSVSHPALKVLRPAFKVQPPSLQVGV